MKKLIILLVILGVALGGDALAQKKTKRKKRGKKPPEIVMVVRTTTDWEAVAKRDDLRDAETLYQDGDRCLTYSKYDCAIENYTKLINLEPKPDGQGNKLFDAYLSRAAAYKRSGNPEAALADYGKAIEVDPKSVTAYRFRGNFYFERGDYEKALADYNKGIEINPESRFAPYDGRASVFWKRKDYDAALADFDKMIAIFADYQSADHFSNYVFYETRARLHFDKGDYQKTVDDYTRTIELYTKEYSVSAGYTFARHVGEMHYHRAKAYEKLGEKEKAAADYEQASKLGYKP